MFDSRSYPPGLLAAATAASIIVAAVVYVWWLRRLTDADREYRSFRATADHASRLAVVAVGLIVAFGVVVLYALVMVLFRS